MTLKQTLQHDLKFAEERKKVWTNETNRIKRKLKKLEASEK